MSHLNISNSLGHLKTTTSMSHLNLTNSTHLDRMNSISYHTSRTHRVFRNSTSHLNVTNSQVIWIYLSRTHNLWPESVTIRHELTESSKTQTLIESSKCHEFSSRTRHLNQSPYVSNSLNHLQLKHSSSHPNVTNSHHELVIWISHYPEVGGWGRDPKKCTGRDWGMGSSTI